MLLQATGLTHSPVRGGWRGVPKRAERQTERHGFGIIWDAFLEGAMQKLELRRSAE